MALRTESSLIRAIQWAEGVGWIAFIDLLKRSKVRLLVCYNSGIMNRVFTDQSNTICGGGGAKGWSGRDREDYLH